MEKIFARRSSLLKFGSWVHPGNAVVMKLIMPKSSVGVNGRLLKFFLLSARNVIMPTSREVVHNAQGEKCAAQIIIYDFRNLPLEGNYTVNCYNIYIYIYTSTRPLHFYQVRTLQRSRTA